MRRRGAFAGIIGLAAVAALAVGVATAVAGWRGLSDFHYFSYNGVETGHVCRDGLDFGAAYPFGSLPNLKVEGLVGSTTVLPETQLGPLAGPLPPIPGVGVDPLIFYSFFTRYWSSPLAPSTVVTMQFSDGTNVNTNEVIEDCWLDDWPFTGFFQPVDNGIPNVMKAGRAVPVKFSLGGDRGMDIFAPGYPKVVPGSGCTATTGDAVEEDSTATNSRLTYDASSDQYTYVWKTEKSYAGSCRKLELKFAHADAVQSALFEFRR